MNIGFTHILKGGIEYLESPLLSLYGVRHCFTTRIGGVSSGHLASLNLGLGRGDDEAALCENFRRVFNAVGFTGENISITKQVHKTETAVIEKPCYRSEGADALITNVSGIPLMSYSADCVPVLMYDTKRRVIASVHSGWRGTAARVTLSAIKKMHEVYGSEARDIICAIGPSIGECCFQIKKDAADILSSGIGNSDFITSDGDGVHYHADLWDAVRQTLLSAGISDDGISLCGECTVCNPDKYFSCRGQHGKFGAMGAIIEIG